jgi:hypothetical protein
MLANDRPGLWQGQGWGYFESPSFLGLASSLLNPEKSLQLGQVDPGRDQRHCGV